MGIVSRLAVLGVVGVMAFAGMSGCEKDRNEMRPDLDTVQSGEHGLQSRDLREMTSKMAPDLLGIPDIVQSPYRVTIVMKSIENKTEDNPGRNMDIYVARLKGLLNNGQARDRLLFVSDKASLEKLQNEELGGKNTDTFEDASRGGTAPAPDPRIKPQFVLNGTFYSMDNGKTTYYNCQFRLTSLTTGAEVWTGMYEVKTLN